MKTRTTLLALPLLALACLAKNNASIEIAAICEAPTDAKTCLAESTCEAQVGGAVLDLAGGGTFLTIPIQVNNQLPNNGDLATFRTNTNDAWAHEWMLTFDGSTAETTGALGDYLPAASSSVIWISIPASAGGGMASLRLRGVYGDTRSWETGEFRFPIAVCSGCLTPPPPCSTAGAILTYCPEGSLQSPQSYACVTPQ